MVEDNHRRSGPILLTKVKKREVWIDLLRGLAVIGMIETHTVNTFLDTKLQATPEFDSLTYLNGLVAPTFFWVMGYVRGSSLIPGAVIRPAWPSVRRLLAIMLIGYLMHGPWELVSGSHLTREVLWRVFMVDVLQCLAISGLIIVALERMKRLTFGLAAATLILVVALADQAQYWRTGFIPFDAYLTSQNGSLFPIFPWAGFAIAGFLTRPLQEHSKAIAWIGITLGLGADWVPFWDSTTAFFLERLGWVTLIAIATRHFIAPLVEKLSPRFGWLELAGRESLTLYVVHLALIHAIPTPGGSLHLQVGPTLNIRMTFVLFLILSTVSLGLAHFKSTFKKPTA